jgi:hypothetical protein
VEINNHVAFEDDAVPFGATYGTNITRQGEMGALRQIVIGNAFAICRNALYVNNIFLHQVSITDFPIEFALKQRVLFGSLELELRMSPQSPHYTCLHATSSEGA